MGGKGRVRKEKADAEEHKQLRKAWTLSGIDPTEIIVCSDAKKQKHNALLKGFLERHCLTCEMGFDSEDLKRHNDDTHGRCKNKTQAGICSSCHQLVANLNSHELSIPKQYHKMFVSADLASTSTSTSNTGT